MIDLHKQAEYRHSLRVSVFAWLCLIVNIFICVAINYQLLHGKTVSCVTIVILLITLFATIRIIHAQHQYRSDL
jgi:membrane protein YdbS with pleckstrin-like domain